MAEASPSTPATPPPTTPSAAPAAAPSEGLAFPNTPPAGADPEPSGDPAPPGDGVAAEPSASPSATPEPDAAPRENILAPEGDKEAEAAALPPIDPASYEITIPDSMTVDEGLLTEFRTLAAESRLPPTAAQPLMDLYAKAMNTHIAALQASDDAVKASWMTTTNALPDFQGPTRETSLAAVDRVMAEFASPALRTFLNETGLGNHPDLVQMVLKVGKFLGEAKPPTPGKPVSTDRAGRPNGAAPQLSFPNTPPAT